MQFGKAWYGDSTYRSPIDFTPDSVVCAPYSVNGTFGIQGEIYWALLCGDGDYTYSTGLNITEEIAIADDSNQAYWLNESNITGYTPTSVYDANYEFVLPCHNESMLDYTSNGVVFTKVGDPTQTSGVFGKGIDFDGAGDYYTFGSLGIFDGDFTIEFWVNFNADERTIFLTWNDEKNMFVQFDYANPTADLLDFVWYESSVAQYLSSTDIVARNTWHYVVIVVNNSNNNAFLYVNNTFQGSDLTVGSIDTASADSYIGANTGGGLELDGQIDDYSVSSIVRSEAYIDFKWKNSQNTLMVFSAEESSVAIAPIITFNTPTNSSYWGKTIYANFSAYHRDNSSFVTKIYLDEALIYTNNSYSNDTSLKINITDSVTDMKDYNIRIYAESNATSTNSTRVFTIEKYEIISTSSDTFVNETFSYGFGTMIRYNPDFFNDISSMLIWNDTVIGNQTTQLDNTTHITNNISYTIPLVATNNSEISLLFENVIHLTNGSAIKINSSSVNQNITFAVWINAITTDYSNYLAGEDINIELGIYNESTTATITANITIIYNSTFNLTNTITSFTMTGNNLRTYEKTYDSLEITVSPTLRNITGNITIAFGGRTRIEGVQTTVNVSTFNITNCTSGDPAIIVRMYNEFDFAKRSGSIELIYFDVNVDGVDYVFSFANSTEGGLFTYCIEPTWATVRGDIYIEYKSSDSPERHYYVTNISMSGTIGYVDVYLLNSTYAYYTNIYLYDENNNKKANTLIRILKMNPENSVYTTMFIDKTDSDGILDIYLEPVVQPYKFYVFEAGEITFTTEAETIPCVSGTCPPYEKSIYMNTTMTGYISFGGMIYSIDWENSTRQLTVEVSDSSGLAQSIKLDIFSIDSFGKRVLYHSTTTNSSTIYYSAVLPDTTDEYLVSVQTMQYNQWYPLAKQTLTITEIMALGILGVLLAIIITTTTTIAGIYTFEGLGGLVGVGAGIGISKALTLIPLGWTQFAGIWVILIIIGFAYINR